MQEDEEAAGARYRTWWKREVKVLGLLLGQGRWCEVGVLGAVVVTMEEGGVKGRGRRGQRGRGGQAERVMMQLDGFALVDGEAGIGVIDGRARAGRDAARLGWVVL